MKNRIITVDDKMQHGYNYELVAPMGQSYDPAFKPELTPKQLLALGVFGGRYMRDCKAEFPADWFEQARFADDASDPSLNYFKVAASQSLKVWQRKGWIHPEDPRGWFQWYCRYYRGRRIMAEDQRQIQRWKAMRRHISQIKGNCHPGDETCRPRQRQALLHWAYDSRKM